MKRWLRTPRVSGPGLSIYVMATTILSKYDAPLWHGLIGFGLAGLLSYVLTDDAS